MCYDDPSVDRHASLSGKDRELPNDVERLKAIILRQQNRIKALEKLNKTANEVIALYEKLDEEWTNSAFTLSRGVPFAIASAEANAFLVIKPLFNSK